MIFIDPDVTFDVNLNFIIIKNNGENIPERIKIVSNDYKEEDLCTLQCQATGRDFDGMSKVLEQSTIINHITGKPMLRASVLVPMILITFFKSWNVENQEGVIVPINQESISKLHYTLATSLAYKWLRLTSAKG